MQIPTMAEPELQSTTPVTRNIVLLAVYATLTSVLFYLQATSWPHEGSWAMYGYVFFVPGILFQSASFAYTKISGRPLVRRALTRVITIPLGLMLAGLLHSGGSVLAMDGFERAYAPFVAQLGSSLPEACGAGAKYFAIPAVAEFNQRTGSRPTGRLHHDDKRFVLSFGGGSIDIDGSTLYYDSESKRWRRYHNDIEEARAAHEKLVAGLTECRLRAG